MTDYTKKTYGRNAEVTKIFGLFKAGKDVSQHGPRRLGKTFVLDRMVEQANSHGFICLKVEIGGCSEPKKVFQQLCDAIAAHRPITRRPVTWVRQKMAQVTSPRNEQTGPWYQPILHLDWESYLERQLCALQDDEKHQWAILIDELPIFLKALHDKGETGINQARDFMNLFSRLRSATPRIRWLITGSIGIAPLAQAGRYTGVLSKFYNFQLEPLDEEQAVAYLKDLAHLGLLQSRKVITDQEAKAIIETVGWLAAFYVEALAQQLPKNPETDPAKVQANIAAAMSSLLKHHNSPTFGTWEEHLRKHHSDRQRSLSFDILNALAHHETGLALDALLAALSDATLTRDTLRQHLLLLITEGFLYQELFGDDGSPYRFRLAPLRLWWKLYRPQASA